jgi:hypothetical protein
MFQMLGAYSGNKYCSTCIGKGASLAGKIRKWMVDNEFNPWNSKHSYGILLRVWNTPCNCRNYFGWDCFISTKANPSIRSRIVYCWHCAERYSHRAFYCAVIVVVLLAILGPAIGNVFSGIEMSI